MPKTLTVSDVVGRYNFKNGYGASVTSNKYSYSLELAVLKNGDLCYTTHLTDDVIGHLKPHEVIGLLEQIKQL